MALSLVTVGAKITAAAINAIINLVNGIGANGVIPASVAGTGVTVSTLGKVSFSGSPSVSVNGCFTSAYENYMLVFDYTTSAASNMNIMLRLAGTDANTAYDNQRFLAQSTSATALQTLNSASIITAGGVSIINGRNTGTVNLFSPALATGTQGDIKTTVTANPMTATSAVYFGGFLHRTATAYDGFSFTTASGTLTGSVRIYGYNNLS